MQQVSGMESSTQSAYLNPEQKGFQIVKPKRTADRDCLRGVARPK
jgi:hypothetical protein